MKPEVHTVYVWQNGQVMVFDQNGKQMPDLQGDLTVLPKIEAYANGKPYTIHMNWEWPHG